MIKWNHWVQDTREIKRGTAEHRQRCITGGEGMSIYLPGTSQTEPQCPIDVTVGHCDEMYYNVNSDFPCPHHILTPNH